MSNYQPGKIRVKHTTLNDFSVSCFQKIGVSDNHAKILGDTLVQADLRGVDSHGISRLPSYIKRAKRGLIQYQEKVEIIEKNLCISMIDGKNNFGQIVAYYGMKEAIRKAKQKETGIGFIGISHTNHIGMAAYYALMAVKEGMIGIVMSNSPSTVAPWGGAEPFLGTNPVAIAVPAGNDYPIVLDMATSMVARGKIRLALKNNQDIPLGWALDIDGNPTTDPEKAIKGALLPFGGPKGYAISLLVQIFSAVLTNSAREMDVRSIDDFSGKSEIGNFMGAIRVSSFIEQKIFEKEIDELNARIRNSKRAKGIERIYLPGEIEFEVQKEREKNGIPISSGVYNSLREIAQELQVNLTF
ncbi:MAG: Ldh family oxidoreductase [Candidatus Caldatribacteriota bacterium]